MRTGDTGARHLARVGIELFKIQLLARWQSNVIMRYVMDAPLSVVTQDYRDKKANTLNDLVDSQVDITGDFLSTARRL